MAQAQFPDDVTPDFPVVEEPLPEPDEYLREIVKETLAVIFPTAESTPEIF